MKYNKRESSFFFSLMVLTMKISSFIGMRKRDLTEFGISKGMSVMDYGCGPGMYVEQAAKAVGKEGKVYAVDIQPLAIRAVERLVKKQRLENVSPVLAEAYDCPLPDSCADLIYAMDMFHNVTDHVAFLKELRRMIRRDGILVLEDGHQKREETLNKVVEAGVWRVRKEKEGYVECIPID